MELKPGYKQTEVGVIPEEWEVFQLGELISYTKGFPFKSSEYQSTGIRVIRVSDTTYDSIKAEDPIYVSQSSAPRYGAWQLKEHDLVVSTVGSKPPMYDSMVGKVILIEKSHENTLLNQNAVLIRDKKRRGYIQRLLLNHLRTKRYLLHIEAIYRGNANQASITLKELFQFGIPLPSDDSEQRAIAQALSDVDALLATLDQMIAKKRDLKQGAMQQLLTGKTRLPGFTGEWIERKLFELADFFDNLRIPVTESKREIGRTPYYGANGIQGYVKGHTHDGEFVLFAEDGANDLNNYPVHFVNGKIWVNNHAHVIQAIHNKATTRYLLYALKNIDFVQVLVGGTRAKLNGSEAKAVKILIPSDIGEQTAIAAVLSDMDAELSALETRRDKTRNIKQAMMQELLTGKTRLIAKEESHV